MTVDSGSKSRFGDIAVEMNFIDQAKLDKALVVQKRVFDKARIHIPIGEVLVEMGAITPGALDEILEMQREIESKAKTAPRPDAPRNKRRSKRSSQKGGSTLDISISKDKLTATMFIEGDVPVKDVDVNDVKIMLHADSILFGIADDEQIAAFLNGEISVGEAWTIASGTEPIPLSPPPPGRRC